MNTTQIQQALLSGTFSNEELNIIADTIKFARNKLATKIKRQISIGSKVTYRDRDITYSGVVEKVAVKFASVRTDSFRGRTNVIVRVPVNMLETV